MAGLYGLPQILAPQPPIHGILEARCTDGGLKGLTATSRPSDPAD
jgi:hypothetical protein